MTRQKQIAGEGLSRRLFLGAGAGATIAATFLSKLTHFEIHNPTSAYDGKLNTQGTDIEGNWKQDGLSARLTLKRIKS